MNYRIALAKLKRFAKQDENGEPIVLHTTAMFRYPSKFPGGAAQDVEESTTIIKFDKGTVYLHKFRNRDDWGRPTKATTCTLSLVWNGKTTLERESCYSARYAIQKLVGGNNQDRLNCLLITAQVVPNSHATKLEANVVLDWRRPHIYGYEYAKIDTQVVIDVDSDQDSKFVNVCRQFIAGELASEIFLDYVAENCPDKPYYPLDKSTRDMCVVAQEWAHRLCWDENQPADVAVADFQLHKNKTVEYRGCTITVSEFYNDPNGRYQIVNAWPEDNPGSGIWSRQHSFWSCHEYILKKEQEAAEQARLRAEMEEGDRQCKSFQVFYEVAGHVGWATNAMRYSTREAAVRAGHNKVMDWSACKTYKVERCMDEPNDVRYQTPVLAGEAK